MKRTVVFYRIASGCPFENFLDSLPGGIVKKITWLLAAVEELDAVEELYFKRAALHEDILECNVGCEDAVFRILCFPHKRDLVILWGGISMGFPAMMQEQFERALRYKNDFLQRKASP